MINKLPRILSERFVTSSNALNSMLEKRQRLGGLYSEALEAKRVTIIGYSGWLGSALLGLLTRERIRRLTLVNSQSFVVFEWGTETLRGCADSIDQSLFEADLVIDMAAVTRDNPNNLDLETAKRINDRLHDRGIALINRNLCGRYLGFSSGAALDLPPNLDWYGDSKRRFEENFRNAARPGDRLLRIWSTSGSFCPKPKSFALTEFLMQAATKGSIEVRSESPVFRRYAPIEETIFWGLMSSDTDHILDSGGELVELLELAEVVRRTINPQANIVFTRSTKIEAHPYRSSNESHDDEMLKLGIQAMTLEEQICNSCLGLEFA